MKKPVISRKYPLNKATIDISHKTVPTKIQSRNRPISPGSFFNEDIAPTKIRTDFRRKASGLTPVNKPNILLKFEDFK